jgi:hypothetical protein
VNVQPFLSGKYPLSDINEAMKAALSPETFRVAIDLTTE